METEKKKEIFFDILAAIMFVCSTVALISFAIIMVKLALSF